MKGHKFSMEDDRDLEFAALYDQIDQIPPEYKNLSSEEIAERCNNAIAALYKNRKENCEIAFGVKTDDGSSDSVGIDAEYAGNDTDGTWRGQSIQ